MLDTENATELKFIFKISLLIENWFAFYVKCDASRGRWRVAIPSAGCEGVNPPIPPKRLDECCTYILKLPKVLLV